MFARTLEEVICACIFPIRSASVMYGCIAGCRSAQTPIPHGRHSETGETGIWLSTIVGGALYHGKSDFLLLCEWVVDQSFVGHRDAKSWMGQVVKNIPIVKERQHQ